MIQYRNVTQDELCLELFQNFIRHQVVTKCWRKEKGKWMIKDAPFIDDWTEADYQVLISCLKNTLKSGGFVYAAFDKHKIKGFVSVESVLFGGEQKYLDLTSIHVSEDMRGLGIGKKLFLSAKKWAKDHGAAKLYISAHSAAEVMAAYWALGCVEAEEPDPRHMAEEPWDVQLEFRL